MKKLTLLITLLIMSFVLVGCGGGKLGAIFDVVTGNPLVQDMEEVGKAAIALDWEAFHDKGLAFGDKMAIIFGAKTIEEEYGPECLAALQKFNDDKDVKEVRIIRNSLLMKLPGLNTKRALMFGPKTIHVGWQDGESAWLDLPHEVAGHRPQWLHAGPSFAAQYFPVMIFYQRTGYTKSLIEEEARKKADAFGNECEAPLSRL